MLAMIKGCRNHSALVERKIRLIEGFWNGRLMARLMRSARRAPSGALLPTRCDQAEQRCRGTQETEQHLEAPLAQDDGEIAVLGSDVVGARRLPGHGCGRLRLGRLLLHGCLLRLGLRCRFERGAVCS
ncbi:hypothetical protein THIOKS11320022 [Thiocapsa sp. KS1]|nr:hypothetical protein THIOKS11320022 [Thiocapsa sp. KS1]